MLKTNIPNLDRSLLEGLDKDQLITIILEQNKLILKLQSVVNELRAQVAALHKNSTNSSKPPSSDMPGSGSGPTDRKNLNSRKPSGRKPGGQLGHTGITRQPVETPDEIVFCTPLACEGCGRSLADRAATEKLIASTQVADIPPIVPTITEYQQVSRSCPCGHTTIGMLPAGIAANDGGIQIGPHASSFLVYLNTAHHLPFKRLALISRDIFHFPLSPGTINNKLEKAALAATPLKAAILKFLRTSYWVGGDETGIRVAGKRIWQWVWQNAQASYYAISAHRDYQTVKDHFGETFTGCLIHDCYSAQNNTVARAHQLCHAHLLRDLQFVVEAEGSGWAYQLQRFLVRSQRARDHIWQTDFDPVLRATITASYQFQLAQFIAQPLDNASKNAVRLQKRFRKHQEKILHFMSGPDIPPDNNGSERAIRNAKTKQKVSGGYRSMHGAERQALLLSVIETAKKQELNVLQTMQRLLKGEEVGLFRGE